MNEKEKIKSLVEFLVNSVTEEWTDKGKIIEAGWAALKHLTLKDASETQIHEMRKAYFCGAQHLWASINNVLESDSEPTDKDIHRMNLINDELNAFVKELKEDIYT